MDNGISKATGVTGTTKSVNKSCVGNTEVTEQVTDVTSIETALELQQKNSKTLTILIPEHARPCYRNYEEAVRLGGKQHPPGVYLHTIKIGKGEPVNVDQWICNPITVVAQTHDQQEDNFGRFLRFKTTIGTERTWAMPMEKLAGYGEECRRCFLSMGLVVDPDGAKHLVRYLSSSTPTRIIRCSNQVGWHDGQYILPNETIGHDPENHVFQSSIIHTDEYSQASTVSGWRENVARLAIDNPFLMLAISGAFAGYLLNPCNIEGGGIHIVGDSSTGKSTALEAACSVHGSPRYKLSWRSTSNGMEGAAASRNDSLLAIDEISECNPADVGSVIYALGNGVGKQRASRSGRARPVTRWRCFALSTGERGIATHMQEAGIRTKAGQSIRLLDIPANRTFGIFDHLHEFPNGRALSDALKKACSAHYGTAGRAFLQKLIEDKREHAITLDAIRQKISLKDCESQEKRALTRFAIIALAGELATEYQLTGWPAGQAIESATTSFHAWRDNRGKSNDETQNILTQLVDFIDTKAESRFSRFTDEHRVNKRAGWYEKESETDVGGRVFWFYPAGLREALSGFEFSFALDVLEKSEVIPKRTSQRLERASQKKIHGTNQRVYRISESKLRAAR